MMQFVGLIFTWPALFALLFVFGMPVALLGMCVYFGRSISAEAKIRGRRFILEYREYLKNKRDETLQ